MVHAYAVVWIRDWDIVEPVELNPVCNSLNFSIKLIAVTLRLCSQNFNSHRQFFLSNSEYGRFSIQIIETFVIVDDKSLAFDLWSILIVEINIWSDPKWSRVYTLWCWAISKFTIQLQAIGLEKGKNMISKSICR